MKRYEFQDEPFMSGAEKELALKAWITFLRHGCRSEHFTERVYDHISLHCSFIAHYNRTGFYEFYFASPDERTTRFLDQFDPKQPGISAEMGATFWLGDNATAADLNHAMRDVAGPYVEKLRHEFAEMKRQADLALASAWAAKYGQRLSDVESSAAPEVSAWLSADAEDNENRAAEQLSIFSSAD